MSDEWDRAPRVRHLAQGLASAALRIGGGFKVEGLEHLPETGPVIVAGNHEAYVDGVALGVAAAPKRFVQGLAKKELYRIPLLGWFLRNAGTIPLDRRGDVQAMRAALELLKRGGCLGVFPEGTRSKDGRPGRPKAGVGFLAARSGAAVVPARLRGMRDFPLGRGLRVSFGASLRLEDKRADRTACLAFSEEVMRRVFSL